MQAFFRFGEIKRPANDTNVRFDRFDAASERKWTILERCHKKCCFNVQGFEMLI